MKSLLARLKDRMLLNAGYLFAISVVGAVAGFFFWTLAARMYDTQQVGLASSVISIVQLLASVATLGLGVGLVRFLPTSDAPDRVLNVAFSLTTLVALLSGSVFLFGINSWSPTLQVLVTKPGYTVGFLAFLIVAGVGTPIQMAYLARRDAKYAFWQVLFLNGIRLTLVVALVGFGAVGIVAALAIGMAFADGLGLLIFLPRLERGYRLRLDWSKQLLRQFMPYSVGNYTADLLYRLPFLLVTPLTLELLGSEASAHVYIAWMIGSLIASPAVALSQSAFAEGSNAPSNLRSILSRAGGYAMGVTIPLALVAGVGASLILRIFGPSYSNESATLLRWLALAAPLMALVNLYFSALRVQRRVGEMVLLAGLVAGVTLAYPFLVADTLQLSTMGIGWFIAQILVAVIAFGNGLFTKMRSKGVHEDSAPAWIESRIKDTSEIVVAIPCYNEAPFIMDVVEKSLRYADQVVVVDDGSTDGTAEVAEGAGALVIRHPTNLGPGAAARTCLEVGRRSNARVLVTLDGDGQHNPEEIPDVVEPILRGEADLVIGSRFLGKENNVARYRKFGIDVITYLYNFGSRVKITDGQSCFRAYGRRALESLRITEVGFGFSVETLIQARRIGLRIREVSISCVYHEESHSANPVVHGVGVALMVLKHRALVGLNAIR